VNKYRALATKGLFKDGEVLYAGFSKRNEAYSMSIRDAFEKAGVKVYPYNPRTEASFAITVHRSLGELASVPKAAVIATKAERSAALVEELHAHGVKRLLFVSKTATSPAILERCASLGITAAVACPLMLYGSGFHRFHGWMAGIRA
jgi:predicted CoA-binding protein